METFDRKTAIQHMLNGYKVRNLGWPENQYLYFSEESDYPFISNTNDYNDGKEFINKSDIWCLFSPLLQLDDMLLVWSESRGIKNLFKRHFSHFNKNGKVVCFDEGRTHWTCEYPDDVSVWDHWRLK